MNKLYIKYLGHTEIFYFKDEFTLNIIKVRLFNNLKSNNSKFIPEGLQLDDINIYGHNIDSYDYELIRKFNNINNSEFVPLQIIINWYKVEQRYKKMVALRSATKILPSELGLYKLINNMIKD